MTDELKAEKGEWSDFSKDNQKPLATGTQFRKAEFMSMSQPGTYLIRLVGTHVKFRRHWQPYKARTHDALRDKDPAWQAGFIPKKRYAINIIDKTGVAEGQAGTLKVMEQGQTVFEAFHLYKETTGIDPAGKDGPNFAIKVDIPKLPNGDLDRLHTSYGVVPLAPCPFTDAEKKILCQTDADGNIVKGENGKPASNLYPLSKIFKPDTIEKMQELWDALPDNKKIAPKKEWGDKKASSQPTQAATPQQSEPTTEGQITEEPVSTVNASSDDLFEDDNSNDSTDLF